MAEAALAPALVLSVSLGLSWATLPASAMAAPAPAERAVVESLPLYVQRDAAAEEVVVRAWIRAGRAAAAPGRGAVAELAAGWLAAGGTLSLPPVEYAAALAAVGARVRVAAGDDLLELEMAAPAGSFRPAVRLLGDLVMYPAFDPAAEAAARRSAARSRAPADDPLVAIGRGWLEGIDADPVPEPVPLDAVGRDDVVRFHRERIGVDTTVLAVEGPVEGIDVPREMGAAFLGFRRAAAPAASSLTPAAAAATTPSPVRVASAALHGPAPGRGRFLVAASGLGRGDPAWLEVEAALLAMALDALDAAGEEGATGTRLRIEQPLGGGDRLFLLAELPAAQLDDREARRARALALLRGGRLNPAAFERARVQLGFALVPAAVAPHAAAAHARLEALGLPGAAPAERERALRELDRASAARSARARLGRE